MLVREIMTRSPLTVTIDDPPSYAAELMSHARVSGLPVVDPQGTLVGILSEGDLLRYAIAPDPRAQLRPPLRRGIPLPTRIEEIMTPRPHTTREGADIAEVASVLSESSWKMLPVVSGSRLVGVISRSDVVRTLAHPDREVERLITAAFHDLGRPGWQARVVGGVAHLSGTVGERERRAAVALVSAVPGVRGVEPEQSSTTTTQEVPRADIA